MLNFSLSPFCGYIRDICYNEFISEEKPRQSKKEISIVTHPRPSKHSGYELPLSSILLAAIILDIF